MKRRREFERRTVAPRTLPWTLPTVSVLLPVYNHAQTVVQAAESALDTQRYPVELIIVDDGSKPDVKAALEPLLKRPNVKYSYQENRGAAAAMNTAAELAQGLFSTRIAADDTFKSHALDTLADFLMSNPSVGFAYANMELINENGAPVIDGKYRPHNHSPSAPNQLFLPIAADSLGFDSDNFVGICNLSRTGLWRIVGKLNEGLLGTEDFEYALRIALLTKLAHIDSDEMLYSYRLHGNSITSKLPAEKIAAEAAMLSTAFLRNKQLSYELLAELSATQVPEIAEKLDLKVQVALDTAPSKNAAGRLLVAEQAEIYRLSSPRGARTIVLPPLRSRPLLLRARDSDYRSVDQAQGTRNCALVFAPAKLEDWKLSAAVSLVSTQRSCTFVVLCENPAEREFADRINLSLKDNFNLRIIDLRQEAEQGESAFEHSLMYVLSNCDFALSFAAKSDELHDLLRLRTQLSAAAHGGLALCALCQSDLKSLLAENDVCRELYEELIGSPHLATELLRSPSEAARIDLSLLADSTPYNQSTLDEWILERSSRPLPKAMVELHIAQELA